MKNIILLAFAVMCLFACKEKTDKNAVETTLYNGSFTLPTIPDSITSKSEKGRYLSLHFWDNYNFADTTLFSKKGVSEQAFVDFLNVLINVDSTSVADAIDIFTARGAKNDFSSDSFMAFTEKYLYNPHSPMYAEELYIKFLRSYIANKDVNPDKKIRPAMHLASTMKNRYGSTATDFTYTTQDGKNAKMSKLKSPLTLIYFNNPLCEECQNTLENMKQSAFLEQMIKDKKLIILSMYVDDEPQMWKEHISDYPSSWIIAMDEGKKIDGDELYSLRLIPSMYLLDKDKKVILKDAQWNTVKDYLNE